MLFILENVIKFMVYLISDKIIDLLDQNTTKSIRKHINRIIMFSKKLMGNLLTSVTL